MNKGVLFYERNLVYLVLYAMLIVLPLYSAGHNNDDWFNLPLQSADWTGHGRYALTFWYEYILSGGRALSVQLLFLYASLALLIESTIFLLKKLEILHDNQVFLFSILSFLSVISSFGLNELISFKGMVSAPIVSFSLLYFFTVRSIAKATSYNLFLVLVGGLFVLGIYQTFFFAAFFPVLVAAFVLVVGKFYKKEMYGKVSRVVKPEFLIKVTIVFGASLLLYIVILEVIKNYYVFSSRGEIDSIYNIIKSLFLSPARLFLENIRSLNVDTLLMGRVSFALLFLAFFMSALAAVTKVKKVNFLILIVVFLYLTSMLIFSIDAVLVGGVPVRSHPFTVFIVILSMFVLIRFSGLTASLKNKIVIFASASVISSTLVVSAAWENTRIMNMGDISKATAIGGALIAIGSINKIDKDPLVFGTKDFVGNKTTFGNSAFHGVNPRRGIFKVLLDLDINTQIKKQPICGEYPALNSISLENEPNLVICLDGINERESFAIDLCKYKKITNRVSLCEFVGDGNKLGLVVKFDKCSDIVKRHVFLVEEHAGKQVKQLYRVKPHYKIMAKHKDGGCSMVIKVTPIDNNSKVTIRETNPGIDIKWKYIVRGK